MIPKSLLAWIPALLYMALIFAVSSVRLPGLQLPRGWDKGIHFVEYAVLGLLVRFAVARTAPGWRAPAAGLLAWAMAAAYGATDELHQAFVPGRVASVYDWLADTLGAGLAVALTLALAKGGRRGPDHPAVPRKDAAD